MAKRYLVYTDVSAAAADLEARADIILLGRLNGPLTVGVGAAAGSAQPMELVGTDAGLALTSTSQGAAAAVEAYVTSFIPASDGLKYKTGSIAFQWADKDTTTGYGSFNIHTSYFSAPGVQADDIWFCGWAKHGAAFFPPGSEAAYAPGDKKLKINGDLLLVGSLVGEDAQFDDFITLSKSAAAGNVDILNRNIHTTGRTRFLLGNDLSAAAGGLYMHGSTHATRPSEVWMGNEFNADTVVMVGGVEALRLKGSGGPSKNAEFASTAKSTGFLIGANQVVGARIAGYTNAWTGAAANRATAYDAATITLPQLAARVRAIQNDMETHGLIGV